MGNSPANRIADPELKRLHRLLNQIVHLAETSSLTGAYRQGAMDAVEKYNLVVARLIKRGLDLDDFFPPLPADASFDRVGVAAMLLASYIAEEESEPPAGGQSLVIGNLEIGSLAELDDLKDIGRIVRESLAGLTRGNDLPQTAAEEPRSEEPAVPPSEEPTIKPSDADPIPMPDLSRSSV